MWLHECPLPHLGYGCYGKALVASDDVAVLYIAANIDVALQYDISFESGAQCVWYVGVTFRMCFGGSTTAPSRVRALGARLCGSCPDDRRLPGAPRLAVTERTTIKAVIMNASTSHRRRAR